MKFDIEGLSLKELSTAGNYVKKDLEFNPQNPRERVEVLQKILLLLEDRGAIDRLSAAAAHKSLLDGKYREIFVFNILPYDKVIDNEDLRIFLRILLRDYQQVENFFENSKVKV